MMRVVDKFVERAKFKSSKRTKHHGDKDMAYNLFNINNGHKALVLRFADLDAARAHAISLFGQIIGEDEDGDCIDALTNQGFVISFEPAF